MRFQVIYGQKRLSDCVIPGANVARLLKAPGARFAVSHDDSPAPVTNTQRFVGGPTSATVATGIAGCTGRSTAPAAPACRIAFSGCSSDLSSGVGNTPSTITKIA